MDASPPAPMAASSPPPAPAAAGQEPEPVVRLSTPIRAPDLGTGGGGAAPAHGGAARTTYPPICQVDHCGADLTGAKAYHRRHKICVAHMRASETPVAGVAQRFC